jgi:hypothetical protein
MRPSLRLIVLGWLRYEFLRFRYAIYRGAEPPGLFGQPESDCPIPLLHPTACSFAWRSTSVTLPCGVH